jgi:hypothetical protein
MEASFLQSGHFAHEQEAGHLRMAYAPAKSAP